MYYGKKWFYDWVKWTRFYAMRLNWDFSKVWGMSYVILLLTNLFDHEDPFWFHRTNVPQDILYKMLILKCAINLKIILTFILFAVISYDFITLKNCFIYTYRVKKFKYKKCEMAYCIIKCHYSLFNHFHWGIVKVLC